MVCRMLLWSLMNLTSLLRREARRRGRRPLRRRILLGAIMSGDLCPP